jgi:ComF family protein
VLSSFTVAALDLVFPARCPVCETTLGAGRRDPLCGACWRAITRLDVPWCERCGAASIVRADAVAAPRVAPQPIAACAACGGEPPGYDYARSAALYEGPLREAIHSLKFGRRRALASPLGDLTAQQCAISLPDGIDTLIPVPRARARARERGFNQAALLARRIGRRLEIPVRSHWLARVRSTRPQSDLSAAERRANVRDAFRASARVAGRHVLVVDDVLTTGATLDACARALRAAGARRVGALTVARVVHAAV